MHPVKDPEKYAKQKDLLYTLIWQDEDGVFPIGYMLKPVFEEIIKVPEHIRGPVDFDPAAGTILIFHKGLASEPERTKQVTALTNYLRTEQTFKLLRGWRNELWPVYGRKGELLYSMERAAMGLFGTTRYGVHMSAFIRSPGSSYGIKMWVPKRAATKSTYPSMLDNTVAGGLMTDEDPFECMIREADEEASLPEGIVRKYAKEVGLAHYVYITDSRSGGEDGYIYPEVQWVYDLELSENVIPAPKDGEVESFGLLTIEEIQELLALGQFKPNCALVMIDFFIRHGILTPENEPNYDEIKARIRRKIPFPGPHEKYYQ
ncbi:putative nudix hydrolase 20 protein [Phaeoacremonium minimum UCRPA7]|uniref:Putative nudix hydrolase 20 protein n=1 Tax=Phaeoacremonium minimum (strain UCR-PA7) TaxID=1286976 RepID=R8BWZ6_PHAM7|nr:putative nudix hydrolase 20 protein [Phaeoacremonium minimum UCRPA7]EOO03857.1 putative nudix hydrolase 20 protein [Phaeoacremonium minimum UCRPA7]